MRSESQPSIIMFLSFNFLILVFLLERFKVLCDVVPYLTFSLTRRALFPTLAVIQSLVVSPFSIHISFPFQMNALNSLHATVLQTNQAG